MRNLLAEMTRYGVGISQIRSVIDCSESTAKNKLYEKTAFSFPEALKIRDAFFPGFRLEYLFASDNDDKRAG